MPDDQVERVNMNWPTGLKDEVREHAGTARGGLTDYVVLAVREKLDGTGDPDKAKTLEKEVDELRFLAQLLADRYVMGGDHEDREAFLMEVELPSWMQVDGWPSNLARLVPKDHVPIEEPVVAPAVEAPAPQETTEPTESYAPNPLATPDPFFDRVQAKAAEKGLDITGMGLQSASSLPTPDKSGNPHNHSWERVNGDLHCACGAWIDSSDPAYPNGIVRAPGWQAEPDPTPEPVAATAPPVERNLDDYEVDF